MSTATEKKVDWLKPTSKAGLETLISDGLRAEINRGLPPFLRGQADRLIRSLFSELASNPGLLDCTPASLFGAVIRAGQLGLTIGGPMGEAYALPFKNNKAGGRKEATLVVGYRGFLQLAYRSQLVKRVTPRVVREGEGLVVRYGTEQTIVHSPVRDNDGEATDFYVVMESAVGGIDFEVATKGEMVAHRDRYALAKSGPWYDMSPRGTFEQMALKTLIRRLAKRMPLSPELSTAAGLDEFAEQGVPQHLHAALPAGVGPDEADELRERMEGQS